MPRALRTFLIALVSIGSLAGTIYLVGAETVLKTLDSIQWPALAAATILVVLNNLLSLLRFRAVLRNFGFVPPLRNLFFAHSIGQVSNQILFNVIGQSLSRAAALTSSGVPFGVSVMATYWERIQAAILLFLLSLAGLWYLFLNIHVDMLPAGQYMLSLLVSLLLASLVVILTVLRPAGLLRNLPEQLVKLIRLWPSVVLTLAAHISMLGAYACLLLGLGIERLDGGMLAAITIVMFTASLPISFAGWGVREFSAAQALGAVGVAEPVAVAAAVAIGLMGLALMLLMAGLGTILVLRRRPAASAQPTAAPTNEGPDWGKVALTACSLICAVLLFFQVRLPLESAELTGNIADLIALTALGFVPYYLWTHRGARAVPRSLVAGLAAISAVLGLSLIIGLLDFGWTGWAFINRGVGWLIILGYIVTGLSIAMPGTEAHRKLVLGAIVATGSALAVMQMVLLYATFGGLKIPRAVFNLPVQGYASNTNAFAVQMIVTIAAAVAAQHLGLFGRRRWLLPAILSVTGLTIYYCHSRAGIGMYVIALATMMIFPGALQRRALLPAVIWPAVALLIGGVFLVPILQLVNALLPMGMDSLTDSQVFAIMKVNFVRESGDLERWISIREGWAMWLEHPIFGAGLGAYMYGYAQMGKSLIIHSTPVWLLAETGVIGCLVVVITAIACLRHTYQGIMREGDGWHIGLMIALVSFAAGNIVHDFFYQRIFWFLLGLCVAVTIRKDRTAT